MDDRPPDKKTDRPTGCLHFSPMRFEILQPVHTDTNTGIVPDQNMCELCCGG